MFQADLDMDDEAVEFERAPFLGLLRRYLDARGLGIEWDAVAAAPAPALINSLSMALPFEPAEKQALLEAPGLKERRAALGALLEIDSAAGADQDDEPRSLQ
jgi:Lon protease-like protein